MCRMSGPWRAEGLEEGFRALVSAWSRIAFQRFEADVKLRTALTTQQAKARPRILPFWRSGLALFAQAEAVLGLAAFHEAAGFAREPGWLARGLDQELLQSAGILRAREGQELRMGEDADLYRELTLVVLKLDNARRMVDENLAPAPWCLAASPVSSRWPSGSPARRGWKPKNWSCRTAIISTVMAFLRRMAIICMPPRTTTAARAA